MPSSASTSSRNIISSALRSHPSAAALLQAYYYYASTKSGDGGAQQQQQQQQLPDRYALVALLQACAKLRDLHLGRSIHGEARRRGFFLSSSASGSDNDDHRHNALVATALVSMYGSCGSLPEAEHVFFFSFFFFFEASASARRRGHGDVALWNAMLSAYLGQGQGHKALLLYAHMQCQGGIEPNADSFVLALRACSSPPRTEAASLHRDSLLEIVRGLHADARRRCGGGGDDDAAALHPAVGTSLLCAYSRHGELRDAEEAFRALLLPDVVPWTALLSAYVENDEGERALLAFAEMQRRGVTPNERTLVCALGACGNASEKCHIQSHQQQQKLLPPSLLLEVGRALHADIRKRGSASSNAFISNALVSMYRKAVAIADAENVFCSAHHHHHRRDVVSWTTMIGLYAEIGDGERALQLYRSMHREGVSPNHRTAVAALRACGMLLGKLESDDDDDANGSACRCRMLPDVVRALHADAQKQGIDSDKFVRTTLISLYGKLGNLLDAASVFLGGLLDYDNCTATWNAMLSTYTEHGRGDKALDLYRDMRNEGVLVDACTLVCVLQACHESGSLDTCKGLHFDCLSAGLDSDPSLATSLIGAYSDDSDVADAIAVAHGLPRPDVVAWNACIAGSARGETGDESLRMFEHMKAEANAPTEASFTSLVSACSHAGLVEQGLRCFESMIGMYQIPPEMKHYVNIVDLLARAGDFGRAGNVLANMPMQPDSDICLCLLGGCLIQGNSQLANLACHNLVHLHPDRASMYVLMSNIGLE